MKARARSRRPPRVTGGPKESDAKISGWKAEVFVPYAMLAPLQNVPPQPGTHWRANFYRCDYDDKKPTGWSWQRTGSSYHEYHKFGTLVFE